MKFSSERDYRWAYGVVGIIVAAAAVYALWRLGHAVSYTSDPEEIYSIQQRVGLTKPPNGFIAVAAMKPDWGSRHVENFGVIFEPREGPKDVRIVLSTVSPPDAAASSADNNSSRNNDSCQLTRSMEVGGKTPVELERRDCQVPGRPPTERLDARFTANNMAYAILADGNIHESTVNSVVDTIRDLNTEHGSMPRPGTHQVVAHGVSVKPCVDEKGHKADESREATLSVENHSDTTLDIDALTPNGSRTRAASVIPHATWSTPANIGQGFSLSSSGRCAAIIVIDSPTSSFDYR